MSMFINIQVDDISYIFIKESWVTPKKDYS